MLTGQAAAAHAGPAIVISMVLAGVVSALAGLCYAELASTVPIAGSAYTYSYATLGEFVAWIIGWDLVLEYALGAATVAVGWSGYFVRVLADFGITFPAVDQRRARAPSLVARGRQHRHRDLQPARGADRDPGDRAARSRRARVRDGERRDGGRQGRGRAAGDRRRRLVRRYRTASRRWCRRTPGTFGEFGWSGVMRGAAVIFFAYIGFDAVSTAAQEARNPQRDMPIGILGSLAICTVLYVAVAAVMIGWCRTPSSAARRRWR